MKERVFLTMANVYLIGVIRSESNPNGASSLTNEQITFKKNKKEKKLRRNGERNH